MQFDQRVIGRIGGALRAAGGTVALLSAHGALLAAPCRSFWYKLRISRHVIWGRAMRANHVKRKLAGGGVAIGTMVFEFGTTGIGRLARNAGAEFVIFDMEHSGWSLETIRMLMATAPSELLPFVRVPATEYHLIAPALDVGAMGLMLPMVESRAQAEAIVRAVRYPPLGRRGAGFGLAHDDYTGGNVSDKMRSSNDEVLVIAQIETVAGVEAAEEIASTPGIDWLWVGQFDLSASLGIPAQFDHPEFDRAIDQVVAASQAHNVPLGMMVLSVEDGRAMYERGFRAFCFGMDTAVYQNALSVGIDGLKAIEGA
jgi:2-dehydro-3-deoxyglucarate aldolase/4-hydroxy-2-oxoheptanedioate aldolase